MVQVLIKNGSYRNAPIRNEVFTLVKGFKQGAKGGFITVDGTARFGKDRVRVQVKGTMAFEVVSGDMSSMSTEDTTAVQPETVVPQRTDEEMMKDISERFEILTEMARATIAGDVRAMIVQGPPGVGKSFGITSELERASMFDEIAGKPLKYEMLKGAITPLGLYVKLYKHSDPGHVLVCDDLDNLFYDELSLNLLKAALDSGKKRRICWNADSNLLRREGVPDSFDFKGSIIFITNLNFDNIRSKKIQDHLAALMSRCHFVELGINGDRGKLLRIQQIINDGMLDEYGFTDADKQEVVNFVKENAARFREISLRLVVKIADLKKIMPNGWKRTAMVTLMK